MNNINCIIVDDEPTARGILESYVGKMSNLVLKKSCKNVMEAFEVLNSEQIDLIFLDINMPEVSGLTLAKSISKKTKIIFTTAYREYAVDGFNLQAVDYLLKPIAFDRFLQAVQKYFDTIPQQKQILKEPVLETRNDFIFVRSERKMVKIDFEDIQFVESLSDYIKIHTKDKTIVTRETITNIESKLPSNGFLRVHRSYVVRLKAIKSYTNELVEVAEKAIPISRSYKETVLQKLSEI
jgi:DNA-binding LytR/AlgR family response regulator